MTGSRLSTARWVRTLLLAALFSRIAAAQQPGADSPRQPLDVGLEEEVTVQLVLVDFLVVDRDGRTVPGLTIDDFKLKVDGKTTEIASLDLDCPIGAADELNVQSNEPLPPGMQVGTPRKIVLVLDYDHITNEAETYARVLQLLDSWPDGSDEHMLASFGEVLRIETPFTADRDELRWALRRMRNDRDLYGRGESRLTENRFFDRVLALMDILQRYEGRKTIVLLSGPFADDGWTRDRALRELSGMSTIARAAVYPVDTGGLRTPSDPARSVFGGPPELRRLAVETGGRMTAETNDITMAYAKAQRDMRCTYTLGVYDRSGELDDKRRLTIKVLKRKELRVVYPQYFIRQSAEKRQASLRRTAGLAPQLFESDGIRIEHFVLGARTMNAWTTLFAVEIGLDAEALRAEERVWNLTGFLRKMNGTTVEKYEREFVVPATGPGTEYASPATLYQTLEVAPGEYAFSVVLSAADEVSPRSATRMVNLAPPPIERPFVIGPILGRASADPARPETGFRPLLDLDVERGERLESRTALCVAGAEDARGEATIERWIATVAGDEIHRYDRTAPTTTRSNAIACTEAVDVVSTAELEPGSYEFRAAGEAGGKEAREARAAFSIHAPGREPVGR